MFEQIFEESLRANDTHQSEFHQAMVDIRKAISGRLEQASLSEEQERHLINVLMETGRMEYLKDTENKAFTAEQAEAARWFTAVQTSLPLAVTIVSAGARLVLLRRGLRL
ncbi:hypothetical protein CLV52_3227 [Amnibacterium kyonggiense]|uniref:Uncharacterized protein n=1 Tax=Amnibacterium kyonggiense TaxID=595671 RepID=A0A4R7FGK5_9MICO|nr:hypothetical protein CLV52_3227 [Amnibacterium kyonggiense]